MWYLLVLFVDVVMAFAEQNSLSSNRIPIVRSQGNLTSNLIVGGHDAEVGQYPFLVSVECLYPDNTRKYFCGGSIIKPQWILTAAHCLKFYFNNCPENTLFVRAGKYNINSPESNEQLVRVEKYIIHENYPISEKLPTDDIALLKLERPFQINYSVRPIRLPEPYAEPEGKAVVIGWGFNDPQETIKPSILQTVDVTIISREECSEAINALNPSFTSRLQYTNICTGPLYSGVAHCGGDSGGPLTANVFGLEELIGVVSWGFKDCGRAGAPSIYAKVSDYVCWITYKIATN